MITPGKKRAWRNPMAFGRESGLVINGSSDDSLKINYFEKIPYYVR